MNFRLINKRVRYISQFLCQVFARFYFKIWLSHISSLTLLSFSTSSVSKKIFRLGSKEIRGHKWHKIDIIVYLKELLVIFMRLWYKKKKKSNNQDLPVGLGKVDTRRKNTCVILRIFLPTGNTNHLHRETEQHQCAWVKNARLLQSVLLGVLCPNCKASMTFRIIMSLW